MRQLIRTYKITGDHLIAISNYSFTKEDVRLIINESLASTDKLSSVLVSSTAKDNIISVNDGVITLSDKTASLKSTDILTIEIDVDNVAKESTVISLVQALSQQMLDNTEDLAKELTNQEILSEIGNIDDALDGLNGENLPFDFVSDYAKQGDNPNATMTELLDAINAISPDLVQGKERLATAITSKGVETTSADSLSQMAENVSGISQESYTIDGGEMYAKQQFGDGVLWNLYQVLADMKTRFMGTGDYAALIVCEYDKTDDSLTLQGADGYYTCDGDYYDYATPIHIWHDYDNNKFNRWVAFLYRQESIRLAISDTAISPLSMYIGGHISTIGYLIEDRLTEFVCGTEDTDVVDKLIFSKNRSNKMIGSAVIKGVQYMECVDGFMFTGNLNNLADFISADVISCNKIVYQYYGTSIVLPYLEKINTTDIVCSICPSLKYLRMPSLKISNVTSRFFFDRISTSIIDVEVGAMETNLRLADWNPTTILADTDKKTQLIDNIKNHILARVSDRTGLSQLVFTVSKNMYNEIASEQIEWQGETMSLADAFLTKNWLFAGA